MDNMTKNEAPMPEEESSKPIVETSVRVDAGLQARLSAKFRTVGLVGLIAGPILILCYIVLSTVFETLAEDGGGELAPWMSTLFDVILWLGCILLVVGLVLFLSTRSSVKNIKAVYQNYYRFYASYVYIRIERQGEPVSSLKLYYADLVKIRETKKFFLLYNTPSTCYVVDKAALGITDEVLLRSILPLHRIP